MVLIQIVNINMIYPESMYIFLNVDGKDGMDIPTDIISYIYIDIYIYIRCPSGITIISIGILIVTEWEGWNANYPSVNCHITMDRSTMSNWTTHYFHWAILNSYLTVITRGYFASDESKLPTR